ncbi:DUF885 domain-containing protein [Amycolatopsis keratiniphila]|uniref:DUF885 domain-containing protein n=1 Tax=Amycolatopsis keratiniphila TaxID=129921 RepID=UPI00087AB936|nr:DUF885 domain-containing protein [Amycolatopsis keratiniphila]OLZ49793.1 hypothetical protein BS330_31185 [Amycolatopsis keratiniphila subsp. nogabecina]SDU24240.1 Uncharacterized conserved protein, DUF885 familyt [Amycolatopsis keratiniphila]
MSDEPTAAELADELLDVLATELPLMATFDNVPGHDHELRDVSEAGDERLRERAVRIAGHAARSADPDRITLGVIAHHAESLLTRLDSRLTEFILADPMVAEGIGALAWLPQLEPSGAQAEEDYLARLAAFPDFFAALAERHRAGITAGRTPVERAVRNAIDYLDRILAAERHPLLVPPLTGDRVERRERLFTERVRPALVAYREVLAREIAGRGRPDDRPGLCWLDGGKESYAGLVKTHTTTGISPEELHETGLELGRALDEEYRRLGAAVFGEDDPGAVRLRMRTDPSLRWRDADEMITTATEAVARAAAAAPGWFRRIPSAECVVRAVPEADGPSAAQAYYMPPSADGSRPGVYSTNTYRVTERFRFIAESVAFHEAVPGHHFQAGVSYELEEVPRLRRLVPLSAFDEGWALYTERLADEMGLYSDDVMRLGMVAEDSLRAARLVVDTGLHALGWSRQRCVDYLAEHCVLSDVEVQSETDRYIEWPGQALSYMTGRLEIQRLRAFAEEQLGEAFDIRDFHDVVLRNGQVPLPVLGDIVREWVTDTRRRE